MSEADALDILQGALWTMLVASWGPVMAAMVIGSAIALLQALTQIQEMTLTFVPKLIGIVLAIGLSAHVAGSQFFAFSEQIYGRVERGFGK
jgi:flagellar biosynthesis protein FliQ